MPAAIAAVLPTIFGAAGSFALVVAGGGLTALGQIVSIVGSLAVSALSKKSLPEPPESKLSNIRANAPSADAARLKFYGENRVGGTPVFIRAKDNTLHRVIVHGHGQSDSILKYYLDQKVVELDSNNLVTDSQYIEGTKKVQINTARGFPAGYHLQRLSNVFPEWTSSHRLKGLCHSVISTAACSPERWSDMYPNREPVLEVVMRGSPVHDPRTNAVAYSDNAALVIRDFLRSDDGFGRADFVDESYFVTAANDCDDTITTADGSPEPRYRISGGYSLEEERGTVLKRLQVACAADMFLTPAGKIGIQVGKWQAPTVTITDDMLIEVSDYGDGTDTIDRYNTLSYKFVDREQDYAELGGVYVDAARKAEHDGKYEQELNYSYVPSNTQCTRLAKIQIEKDNPSIKAKIVCKPMALIALYETVIRWESDIVGVDGAFRIVNYGLDTATGRVTYTLESINESAFDVIEEELHQAPLRPQLTPSGTIPIASGFTAFAKGVRGNSLEPSAGIFTNWSAITPTGVYLPVLEIRQRSVDSWRRYQLSEGSTSYHITGLIEYEHYDVRVAFQSPTGNVGNYVLLENVEASCAPDISVPILQVQDVTASQGLYRCLLTWSAVSAQDFKNYSVWRNTSDAFVSATKIAETTALDYADEDLQQQAEEVTELFYWVTANYYCRSDVGPASDTVSATPRKITAADIAEGSIGNSHLSDNLQLEVEHFGEALTEAVSTIADNAALIDIANADIEETNVTVSSLAERDLLNEIRSQIEWLSSEAIRSRIDERSVIDELRTRLFAKIGTSEAKYNQLIQTVANLDSAFTVSVTELEAKVDDNHAELTESIGTLTTTQQSQATASQQLRTEFDDNKAEVSETVSALSTATGILANQSDSLRLELNNLESNAQTDTERLAAEAIAQTAQAIAERGRQLEADIENGKITYNEINRVRVELGESVATLNEQINLQVTESQALSQQVSTLSASVGNNSTQVQQTAQALADLDGNLSASWMISAGVGTNATTLVLSNAVSPDGSVSKQIAMRGDLLVDGTVSASALKTAEVEALVGTFNYVKTDQVDARIGNFNSLFSGKMTLQHAGQTQRMTLNGGNSNEPLGIRAYANNGNLVLLIGEE